MLRLCFLSLFACALVACGAVTDPNARDAGGGGDDGGAEIDANTACGTCGANAECVGSGDDAVCQCRDGFDGDGQSCVDIDECATGSFECADRARCSNVPGSYRCDCPQGYVGDGEDECRTGLLFYAAAEAQDGNGNVTSPRYFRSMDVTSGVVSDEALMPADSDDFCNCGLGFHGPISAAGSLYYFGNHSQRYRDAWSPVPRPAHARRGEYGGVYAGGRIYMVGGRGGDDGKAFAAVDFYDPNTGEWSGPGDVASLPWAVTNVATGAIGDKIMVVAAQVDGEGNAKAPQLAIYDLAANFWTPGADPPFAGRSFTGVVVGKIFFVHPTDSNTISAYFIEDDSWSVIAPIALPQAGTGWRITAVNGALHAIGEESGEIVVIAFGSGQWNVVGTDPGIASRPGYVGSSNLRQP